MPETTKPFAIPINVGDVTYQMALAEHHGLPGFAKHQHVLLAICAPHIKSDPPSWLWLLAKLLDTLIPLLLDWLKKRYGDKWPHAVIDAHHRGKEPWHESNPATP